MKMTCPSCGGDMTPTAGGFRCPYCGDFVKNPLAKPQANETSFVSPKNEEIPPVEKVNTASNVYERSIAGVCIIRNIEDQCSGSGFIYKSNGLVITNAHVIYYERGNRPSNDLRVIVNGSSYKAHVVNSNRPEGNDDIALLKIESSNFFHELPLGNSNKVHNGEEVIAIGNPKGEGLSITRGIVSDAERYFGEERFIMSDVTINSGNSGGPLFNEKGEVIAICVSSRIEADNMNYFIPINHVLEVIRRWGY